MMTHAHSSAVIISIIKRNNGKAKCYLMNLGERCMRVHGTSLVTFLKV